MHQIVNWYDDEDRPNWNNWTDVEGQGYGWLWLRTPESKWNIRLQKLVHQYVWEKKKTMKEHNEPIIKVITDSSIIYHFIERDSNKRDVIFEFSNEELYW